MLVLESRAAAAAALSVAFVTIGAVWLAGRGTDAADAQSDVLPSLSKQRIESDGGPLFEQLMPGSVVGKTVDKRAIEAQAQKMWPGFQGVESEIVLVIDSHQVPEVRRPLWVVSMRFPGGGDPFRGVNRAPADKPGALAYFYQTFDPVTAEPLWAQSGSDP